MQRRRLLQLLATPVFGAARVNRIVVAGAGIIGASIAYHLVKRGAQVTILEKQRPGSGATQNSFAWINATFSKQPRSYYDLNLLGIAGWRRLCLELGDGLHVQWGGSVEWHPPGADSAELRRSVERHQQLGYSTRLIEDAAEVSKLLPAISPGPFGAGCYSDQEGTVDPMHALGVLLTKAQQLGAKLEYPCEITGLSLTGGRVRAIQTSRGPMEADALVLACGVDTPRLARIAGVHVPLKESPGVLAHSTPQPAMLGRVALAPGANMKQNHDGRIVTGTDFGGSPVNDTSQEYGTKLLQNAGRFLEKLKGVPIENVTLGHRVMPQDEFPIVGFSPPCPNLYIAAMHSGITLSPVIGQFAAAEILDATAVDLLKPYRPSRFDS